MRGLAGYVHAWQVSTRTGAPSRRLSSQVSLVALSRVPSPPTGSETAECRTSKLSTLHDGLSRPHEAIPTLPTSALAVTGGAKVVDRARTRQADKQARKLRATRFRYERSKYAVERGGKPSYLFEGRG